MNQSSSATTERALVSVNQWCARHPGFSQGGMRHLIFNAATNGLAESGAVLRCGRKVLIDEARFMAWLDARNGLAQDSAA